MKILKQSKEFTSREKYKLFKSESSSVKELVGLSVKLEAWAIREDVNAKDEEVTVWSGLLSDGTVLSTISETFIHQFQDILDCYEDEELPEIIITSGTSRAGRDYVGCTIA